ncbi:MAG: autotransporter-associated beta strand repeat-containing protein, partial [Thermoguttaceae bacterium]
MIRQLYGSYLNKFVGLLIISIFLFTAATSLAVTLTWNPAGGPVGTWDYGTANWSGSSTTWISGYDAVFGSGILPNNFTAGGLVTVDAGGISVQNMTFNLDGYTIGGLTPGAGGPITLTGTPTITVANGATATINSFISGTGIGLTKSGSGTLTFAASNSYSGGTTVNTGTLQITDLNGLGAATGAVSVSFGATLWLNYQSATQADYSYASNAISGPSGATLKITGPGTGWSTAIINGDLSGFQGLIDLYPNATTGNGKTRLSGASGFQPSSNATIRVNNGTTLYLNQPLTYNSSLQLWGAPTTAESTLGQLRMEVGANYAGSVALYGNSSIGSSGNSTVSGNIGENGGPWNLTKASGTGNTLFLTGNNSYTGTTTVTNGTLQIGVGGLTGSLGAGTVTDNATLSLNRGDNITVANAITGTGAINKYGYGTTTLTSNGNTYSGATNVLAGTLQIGDGTNGVKGAGAVAFNGTATLNFNEPAGSAQANTTLAFTTGDGTVQSTYGGGGLNTSVTFTTRSRTAGATGNFVVSGGANGSTNRINLTQAAGFIDQGTFFGGGNYAYMDGLNTFVRGINYGGDANSATSAGALTLAGINYQEFTGAVTAQASATFTTLQDSNNSNFTLASGATVTTNGILKTGNVAGGATISGGAAITPGSGAELVIRTDGPNDTLTINTPITANGTNALTKSGAGTLNLYGANTYTGQTYVDGGVLNMYGTLGIAPAVAAGIINVTGNAVLNIQSGANIRVNNTSLEVGNSPWVGGSVYQSGGTVTGINQMQLGYSNIGSYGYYSLSGGSLTVSELDDGGFTGASVGVLDISGTGSMTVTSWLVPARGTGGTGVINMTGGTLTYNGPTGQFLANWNGYNYIQSSTVINVKNASLLAAAADVSLMQTGAIGKLGEINLLTGGVFQAHSITPGSATGTSLVNFNGGTLKASTVNTTFLTNANLTGVYVYGNGGTIDNNGVAVTVGLPLLAPTGSGVSNTVTITAGGSGYTGAPAVRITGNGVGAAGYATVSGGQVTGIVITNPGTGYTGTPTISLLGGGGGGASTSALTLAANTSGGMTFTGSGTTTLTSSTSTYTGTTTVNSGTLLFSGSAVLDNSSGININGSGAKLVQNSSTPIGTPVTVTNGTLDGTSTVNSVVVASGIGNTIANGGGIGTNPFTINSLTFSGAGALQLSTTPTTTSPVLNVSTLTTGSVAGSIKVNASSASWAPTTYYLVNYTTLNGLGFGAFTKGTIVGLSNRQSATLTSLANTIALTIAGDNPVWTGAIASGNPGYGKWTTATLASPKNWQLITSGTPTDYIAGDNVLFDDTVLVSGGTYNVNISDANVSPSMVRFNNNAGLYTISSTGSYGITGAGSLTIDGYGGVTLNTANSYSGGTMLNNGALNINNASAIGTGALTITANTAIDNTSGSPITLTTANLQNWNGDFTFGGTNDLNLGTGAVTLNATPTITVNTAYLPNTGTLTVGGAISGAGFGITKAGLGTLVLTGANTYSGNTTVNAGMLTVGPGGSIDSSANSDSNISVASGAAFNMNGGNVTLGNNVFTAANNNNLMMLANDSAFNIASGTLTCSNGATSWNQIRGTFTQTGGSFVTRGFSMSDGNGVTSNYYLVGTGAMSVGQGNWASLPVGARGIASFYMSGSSSLTVTGAANPANNNANQLVVGAVFSNADAGTHLFVQQGGTITTNGLAVGSFSVTGSASAPGVYFLNGGTLITSTLTKGAGSTGTLNFGGGTLRTGTAFSTDTALTTNINSGGAIIDTTGGDLTWSGVLAAGTTGSAGFTSLTNTDGVYTYVPGVTFIGACTTPATGIAVLNQAGQVADIVVTNPGSGYTSAPTISIDAPSSGSAATATGTFNANPGGLTKIGAGTLTLPNTNTYTGPTAVSAGKLLLSGAGSINTSSGITINGSAAKFVQSSSVPVSAPVTVTTGTLDGTTTVNTVVVTAGTGGIVSNGDGTTNPLTIGSLTFSGAGALSLNTAGAVALNTTTLTASGGAGSVTVNAAATTWTSGTVYDLVSYTGAIGGTGFSAFTTGTITGLTPRQGATLTNSTGYLALSITGGNIPVWTGVQNGNWTTTPVTPLKNWKLQIGGASTDFLVGDSVLFDDSATGTTAVSISDADVSPTLVTFNNTTTPVTGKTYTISSSSGFAIVSGALIKNGNGSVTINTNNTYTGGTTVNNGSLLMTGNNNFGTGGVTMTGGSATFSGLSTWTGATTVSGGSLILSTGVTIGTGSVTVNGGTLDLGGLSPTFTSLQSTTSGGAITNNGTASVLTLNSGAYSGNINDGAGTVTLVKTTTGIQTLSGASSNYSGGTTITAGTLAVGSNNALGTGLVTMNGCTIAASVAGVNLPNNFQADVGSTFNTTNSFTISGNITDNVASQPITGAGTLTLAGTNNFLLTNSYAGVYVQGGATLSITGSTTIGGTGTVNGYMTVGSNTAGNGTVTVLPGGTLTINGNGASSPNTIFGQLAATGALDVNGGNVIVGPGTGLIFGNADAAAVGTLNVNSGTITVNSNLTAGSDPSA